MSDDIVAAFKALSLHGMASAWPEMLGTARMKALDHETVMHQLLKAERAQREVRSMAYQMRAARFPAHRDLAGFAFDQASVNEALMRGHMGCPRFERHRRTSRLRLSDKLGRIW